MDHVIPVPGIALALLRRAGVGIAVADAVEEVRRAADWVTSRPGGRGAVREMCDAILKFRGASVR